MHDLMDAPTAGWQTSALMSAALPPPGVNAFTIAVLPGDGIGPEVVAASLDVLRATEARLHGVRFDLETHAVGAGEYQKNGDPLPSPAVAAMRRADAILLGAMGLPDVRWPNGVEMTPQIDIREQLDLYNGVRPIRLYHPSHTPLKGFGGAGAPIDFVIVRENCEGLFSDRLTPRAAGRDFETDTLRITRRGAERICRAAFRLARSRRRHCTLVDKANVLPSMAFFRRVFDDVAREFPDVRSERVYVDAMALFLVQRPHEFDVLVTENMFGDILSDLGAGLVGGMGLAPSADLGDEHGLFQPAHGTAPTLAGRGIANPIATILSVALMLDWLDHPETRRGARLIEHAVATTLADPAHRTADLGGNLGTKAMTTRVIEALHQSPA
ncbi:MAG: isocitrate/isopropylmalate dehydrogenase family protein [Opitutaceae bacterium]|nr:isocitrate/isopropylmalate dehydrogenase family protein [Opitutaceae bacterium]